MRHPDSGPPATFRKRPHRSALTSARRARPTNMQDGGSEKTSSCGHSQNPWPLTKSMGKFDRPDIFWFTALGNESRLCKGLEGTWLDSSGQAWRAANQTNEYF